MFLLPDISRTIQTLKKTEVMPGRKPVLHQLQEQIQIKISASQKAEIHFICTHNSRRSQFAQVWAHTLAAYFKLDIVCYSGGTEVTACNPRVIAALQRAGFTVSHTSEPNPKYAVRYSETDAPLILYSKLFDDAANPKSHFIAVMTCSDADENCPYVPGADVRIKLLYDDPKQFDDTALEKEKYDERCMQIGAELYYVMQSISEKP